MLQGTRRLVFLGLLSGLGLLLMFFLEFPLPLFPPYLKYDASQIPALLAAFGVGPWAGVAVEFVKSLLFLLSGKDPSGFIGPSAAFLAGATLTLTSGFIYRAYRGKGRTLLALIAGGLAMAVVMTLANYWVFLPAYGIPGGQVAAMATGVILPFNLVKGVVTTVIALILFSRLRPERLPFRVID